MTNLTRDFSKFEQLIGYNFKNKKLLICALTHRSYLNESKDQTIQNNERLEFLGDAVLSLVATDYIFDKFKDYQEGQLTALRSLIVRTKTLAAIATQLELGDFLLLSKGETQSGGRTNETLLANTYEAILGAIYQDKGLAAAKTFVEKTLLNDIAKLISNQQFIDNKSLLQQVIQENYHKLPTYKLIAETGPDHLKTFKVGVALNQKIIGIGEGKNKQQAEQEAAKVALERLNYK